MSGAAYLIVRTGTRRVGLSLEHLVEVIDAPPALPVPSVEPSLRGLVHVRESLIPLIHLEALLSGAVCPPARGSTGIVCRVGRLLFCLEVDAADEVVREAMLSVAADAALPWATGVAVRTDGYVPLLDLGAVSARLAEASV